MITPEQHIHHEHTLAEKAIWYLCHSFGAVTILACIITGAAVLLIIVFRKAVKEKFGALIKLIDKLVNKE